MLRKDVRLFFQTALIFKSINSMLLTISSFENFVVLGCSCLLEISESQEFAKLSGGTARRSKEGNEDNRAQNIN